MVRTGSPCGVTIVTSIVSALLILNWKRARAVPPESPGENSLTARTSVGSMIGAARLSR